jgi:uncharacterized protein YfbU (UPF0304 family)
MKGKVMYNVTVRNKLEIDQNEAGRMVGEILKSDFEFIAKEINELHGKLHTLKDYERQDLLDNMEIYDAMKALLRYYLTRDEYTMFMELQRSYGNVR